MCTEGIAQCDFCGFERSMGWERCGGWIAAYRDNVKYTHVFSNPPMPDPNLCPNKEKLVKMAIRPGSCPRGPTRAYLQLYLEDEADYETAKKREETYGTRGSGKDGCVGYEVRAEIKGLGMYEWDRQWSHRTVRERMGLDELSFIAGPTLQRTHAQPTLNLAPQPGPARAALPTQPLQGQAKTVQPNLAPPADPVKTSMKWTDQLKKAADEELSAVETKSDESCEMTSQPLPRAKSPRLQSKGKGRAMCETSPNPEEEEIAPRRFVHELSRFGNVLDSRRDKKTGAVRLVIPHLPAVPDLSRENIDRSVNACQRTAPAPQTERKQEQARPQPPRRQTTHNHVVGNRRRVQFANAGVAAEERRRESQGGPPVEGELHASSGPIPITRARRDRQFNGPMMMPH